MADLSGGPPSPGEMGSPGGLAGNSTTDASVGAYINWEPVTDGKFDIATTIDKVEMKVEAVGRMPQQKVWLWDAPPQQSGIFDGGKNSAYDTGKDLNQDPSRLPTKEELTKGPYTKEYLKVGIVIGADPIKYLSTGQPTKAKEEARKERGILRREPTASRVFIATSPHISQQTRYFVGVHPQGGRNCLKTIDASYIFFYPEFWLGVKQGANKKERTTHVNGQTKYYAARQKISNVRSQAPITVDELAKLASSNPLAVTALESFSTTITLLWKQYLDTNQLQYIDQALECLDQAAPELRYGPHSSMDSVIAFFHFDEDFSITEAEQLQRELKSVMPTVQSELIHLVRKMLADKGWAHRVLPNELVALLLGTQWLLGSGKELDAAIDLSLGFIANGARHVIHGSRLASVPSFGDDTTRILTAAYRDDMKLLLDRRDEKARALAIQHGGITRHSSIEALMKKGGEATDSTTRQNILEQLSHIHALQFVAGHNDEREFLVDRIAMLDQMLARQATRGD